MGPGLRVFTAENKNLAAQNGFNGIDHALNNAPKIGDAARMRENHNYRLLDRAAPQPGFLSVRCVHAHDETRRIALNIAKLPELLQQR